MLQWSHVLTNVETYTCAVPPSGQATLQWSHVLTNVETRGNKGEVAGSVGTLQWSHVLTNVETTRSPFASIWLTALQLSHVLTNVETRGPSGGHSHGAGASMEPRPHERGNESPQRGRVRPLVRFN